MSTGLLALGAGGAVALADDGESAKDPRAIIADAKRDLAKVKSYHFAGQETDKGSVTKLTGDVFASGSTRLTITDGKATARLVVLPKAVYIKGNTAFWRTSGGKKLSAAALRKLADRWIKETTKQAGDSSSLVGEVSPKHLASCLDTGTGTLTAQPSAKVAGQDAVVLQDAGDKPGTAPGRYYLTAGAPVLPLRIVQTGPRKKGTPANADCGDAKSDTSTRSDLTFSRFGKVAPITAPHGAIALDDLAQGGGGGGGGTPV